MALAISPIKTSSKSYQVVHPKYTPESFENVSSIGTGHGDQLLRGKRRGFARSRSDIYLPNRIGNKNKHIYANNILNTNTKKSPTANIGMGKRITDVTSSGTDDHVNQLISYSSQSSPSLHPYTKKPSNQHQIQHQQDTLSNNGKGKFAYSSDQYYDKNNYARDNTFQKSCYHNIASREPNRAFFKHDYATSKHNNMQKRGLRNFDKLGFGESYVTKYDVC